MARIRSLNMNFTVVRSASGDELRKELLSAWDEKRPIVIFNWTPTWVEAKIPGKFVEFPKYSPECETDPAWGVNPDNIYDCGNPREGWMKKIAWSGMESSRPVVFKVLKKINFTGEMISMLVYWVDIEGLSEEEAVGRWIEENEFIWQGWLPDGVSSGGS